MKSILLTSKSIPLLFAIVTVIAYGSLLPLTGFYWDDWPFAWIAEFQGPGEFFPAFAGVRPFLSPIFFVTTSLIPPVPIYWQIFALVIRFASGLAAWFAFDQIWPHHKGQTLIASLLFLVFPGYSQHWVAFTHINQEWIPFIFYLLSFGFTARALRKTPVTPALHRTHDLSQRDKSGASVSASSSGLLRRFAPRNDTLFALLFLIAGVFPTEYFVSIEPMRFLLIWFILAEEVTGFWPRLMQTLKRWWPYLLIWLGNAAWLAYFYTLGTYSSYEVEVVNEPLTVMRAFSAGGDALWKAGFYAWGQVLIVAAKAIATPTSLLTFALIGLSFAFFCFYLGNVSPSQAGTKNFAVSALLIGIAGIVLGRIPSLAAGLPLTLQSSFDRFMISMMLGASLFAAGLVELLIRNVRVKTYVFALLVALGIGQQFFNANIFRRDWARQQDIYWQLAWRIPALKPDTALLTKELYIDYETDLSFTAPVNWMYAPDYQGYDLPYALLFTDIRLGSATLPSLEKNTEINLSLRRSSFHGSTSQVVVIHMPGNGCLRVLDPARGDEITYSQQSRLLVDAIPLSDPSLILLDRDVNPKLPFLNEPNHTWCYYYAKAELAYQQADWNSAIDFVDQAISLGYGPEDPFEWLAYIEAQALTGNIDAAEEVSKDAFARDNGIRRGLCQVWKRVQTQDPAGSETKTRVDQVLSSFQCAR